MAEFSHLNAHGEAHMVDVGEKPVTLRKAVASALLRMKPETLERLRSQGSTKGDLFGAARIAGIMAAKRTPELIPLCHSLPLEQVTVDLEFTDAGISIRATAICHGKTGIEMEALVAASVAALTLYDMCKAVDKTMSIEQVTLVEKLGGRSGHYQRSPEEQA